MAEVLIDTLLCGENIQETDTHYLIPKARLDDSLSDAGKHAFLAAVGNIRSNENVVTKELQDAIAWANQMEINNPGVEINNLDLRT